MKPYEWDFYGICTPLHGAKPAYENEGFSVGIFQWIPRSGVKKGLKRGRVEKRIKGLVANPQEVFDKAIKECKRRNEWVRNHRIGEVKS